MPELPEVETIVRGLAARLPGCRIEDVAVTQPDILRTPSAQFLRAMRGATVLDVRRFGKFILARMQASEAPGGNAVSLQRKTRGRSGAASHLALRTSNLFYWLTHLGMTGQFILSRAGDAARPHTHAWFELDSGESLRYIDVRRFGCMEVTRPSAEPVLPARLKGLGPEPLEIGEDEFTGRVRSRNARLKALLLDQRFLRGLGNIYADETLFRAGLLPSAIGARLSPARAGDLWRAMREVLKEAIAHGGSSISDYVDASGEAGFFQAQHRVYGRSGQPCLTCAATLRRAIVAGRGTAWCPRCQRKR